MGDLRTPTDIDPSAEVFMPSAAARRPHVADATATIDDAPPTGADHAALGRIAALVARGAAEDALFNAVVEEIGRLVGADRSCARPSGGSCPRRWRAVVSKRAC